MSVASDPTKNLSWSKHWHRRPGLPKNAVLERMLESHDEGVNPKSDWDSVRCDVLLGCKTH